MFFARRLSRQVDKITKTFIKTIDELNIVVERANTKASIIRDDIAQLNVEVTALEHTKDRAQRIADKIEKLLE